MNDELREKVAAQCHELWSWWLRDMFNRFKPNADGEVTLPKWVVEGCTRLVNTSFVGLSSDDQDAARAEADKFLKLFADAGFIAGEQETLNVPSSSFTFAPTIRIAGAELTEDRFQAEVEAMTLGVMRQVYDHSQRLDDDKDEDGEEECPVPDARDLVHGVWAAAERTGYAVINMFVDQEDGTVHVTFQPDAPADEAVKQQGDTRL